METKEATRLNEAFLSFTLASKSLEAYYDKLHERVKHLTEELRIKNNQIEELERHEERNKRLIAMGEMAAKIVHEIRSPLCSIELYAGMLVNDLQGSRHVELAKGISSGIKSLNNILTNMLLFAKSHKPAFGAIDINRVVDDSLHMLMPMIESRKIRLSKDVSCWQGAQKSGGSVYVSGDSELLKQVFLNILLNAVDATPEGGEIRINLKSQNGRIGVEIIDQGEGIRQEDIERIFDPFFSTKARGTGLGLAIASKIMQVHGGSIMVQSEAEKGSCFRLCFSEWRQA
ncbi:MAG: hypothetical protein HY756_06955 [Nitrospirae bacterium]|nr:hypothetical protein [Nitrospirota bacterium]